MRKEDIIRHFGSAAAAARAFGISKQAVARWPEKVPPLRALQAEALSGGALKADPGILRAETRGQCGSTDGAPQP